MLDFPEQAASALANRRSCAAWGTVNLHNKSVFDENAKVILIFKI